MVPPPLQNNVVDEEEIEEEVLFEDTDQDMNYFGEQLSTDGFVTEEEFLNAEYYDADMFETKDDLNLKMTTVTADVYQNEPKKTLNLRSSPKHVVHNPKKKVVVPTKQQSDPVSEKKQLQDKQKKSMEVEEVNKTV